MMFWYSDHMSGWGWLLMSVGMVAFWGLLIVGVLPLIRPHAIGRGAAARLAEQSMPERFLAGRFARGGIDEPEYAGRLAALRRQTDTRPPHTQSQT